MFGLGGIRAGALDRRVEILKLASTIDAVSGEAVKSYSRRAFTWANIRSIGGYEKMRSGREDLATKMNLFRIRYRADIETTDIIVFNGAHWGVQSLAPGGRRNREWIEVMAEQVDMKELIK